MAKAPLPGLAGRGAFSRIYSRFTSGQCPSCEAS
nr:MAG TPA: NADH-ubiquinone oxidoreductase [Caudoviricetes sp.]